MDKEIEKIEKQIQEVVASSDATTSQYRTQLTDIQKQVDKREAEKREKERELSEVRAANEKQQHELTESLANETQLLHRETDERWAMAMEDVRSLYATYAAEKARHDTIIEQQEAEIQALLKKGQYAAASIQAKGGKVGLVIAFIYLVSFYIARCVLLYIQFSRKQALLLQNLMQIDRYQSSLTFFFPFHTSEFHFI